MANHTILLIDYDPRSIESLRTPLVSAGYRVEVAKDGIAGSRRFAELLPDLTLVEAMIPKKHGFEVCQELKRSEHGKNSPVVIITGVYKGRKYRHQARHQYGCDEFLEKPISPTDLLAVVHRFLGTPPIEPDVGIEAADDAFHVDADEVSEPESEVEIEATEPTPATQPPRTPTRSGDRGHDSAEAEISEAVDALLPGESNDSSEPRASTLDDNVIVFDSQRTRTEKAGVPTPSSVSPPNPPRTNGGGAQAAAWPSHAPEPDPVAQPDPHAAPAPAPPPRTGRIWLWIALALLSLLSAALVFSVL